MRNLAIIVCTILGFLVGTAVGALAFSKYSKDERIDARGRQIAAALEGQLVTCPDPGSPESGGIFLIEGGEKHWIATPKWLLLHGYSSARLRPLSAKDLAAIPSGTLFD